MIVCPKCSKENQDHYKFCLGCGNELPRNPDAQRPFRAPTPAAGRSSSVDFPPPIQAFDPPGPAPVGPVFQSPPVPPAPYPNPVVAPVGPVFQSPPAPPTPPAPPAPANPVFQSPPSSGAGPQPPAIPASCPQCASPNPRGNRFCITCGFDMAAVQSPPSPPPAPLSPPSAPAPFSPPVPFADPTSQGHPQAPAAPTAPERARLVLILPNGSDGASWPLTDGENPIGRTTGGPFAQDTFLSPHHATFVITNGTISVRDESSLNGIYVRIGCQQPIEIRDGDVFRIGQEILRFEAFGPVARPADGTEKLGAEIDGLVGKIVLVTGRDSFASAFPVPITGLYLGRERGDILFPDDGYVSSLHCQLAAAGGKLTLTDVGSTNGSYVRLRGGRQLRNGDFLLLGQQLFRLQAS